MRLICVHSGKEASMRTLLFGSAAMALALGAGLSPAGAQWVQEYRPVVTTQPVPLTQTQRTIIYRTIIPQGRGRGPIVRERIVTEPVAPAAPVVRERVVTDLDSYAYGEPDEPAPLPRGWVYEPDAYSARADAVGTRVAPSTRLTPLPREVVARVPAVRSYEYMTVAGRVLLVDPISGVVVAEVTR
jgi:hypothetical protein